MKKLVYVVAIAISSIVNGQCFTSINQSQNKLLDAYGIHYASLQTRYLVSTNQLNSIQSEDVQTEMIKSYQQFTTWNKDRLQIIPDTNTIETGADYISNKIFIKNDGLIHMFLNESHKVLQKIQIPINRDNIKSIEIVEFYMSGYLECTYIFHMIFIENYNGTWMNFNYDENDTTLECPYCSVS